MKPVINLDRFWKFCSALRITDKENPDGLVPLIPFKTQTYVVNEIAAGLEEGIHKFVILKFRQAGMTTIGLALDLYWLNKFPGLPGTFVADSDSNREHFRAIIDEYIKSVAGGHWHIGLKHHNRNHLILDNRSRLTYQVASSRNDRLGQGKGMSFGHFSECSSWDNDEGLMSLNASLAETNPSRLYIYESTAQGYNLWHDMWKDAKNSMAQKAIFLGWWMHERYVVKKDSNIYRVYWDGKLDADERMWVKHVKSLYDHDVTPEQMAWWRFTLAEKFHSDLTMMKQEFPPCVTAETRVGTDAGMVRISEARTGMLATMGKVVDTRPNSPTKIYKMTTAMGYSLRGTADHPIFTPDGELLNLSDTMDKTIALQPARLATELYVARWREGPIESSITITPDLGRFVGIFMGDGSLQVTGKGHGRSLGCGHLSIACTAVDRDFIDETKLLIKSLFGLEASERIIGVKKGGVEIRIASTLFGEVFHTLGLVRNDTGPTQRKVHVPEFIFRSPPDVVREFLSGLFETDGFNAYGTSRCVLFSMYRNFLEDVQLLLLSFGITSRVISKPAKTKGADGNPYHYIANELLLRKQEATAFNEKIGFLSDRKRRRHVVRKKHTNEIDMKFEDVVVSVVEDGFEPVYNLTIEGDHAFDANGILTHNTEHDAFQMSGAKFFDGVKVNEAAQALKNDKYQSYKFEIGQKWDESRIMPTIPRYAELKMWEGPKDGAVYVVSGDPAYGSSEWKDNFCAQVFKCYADGMEQVAEYASAQCSTQAFAWLLCYLAGFYKNSTLIIEINGPGQFVWNEVLNLRRTATGQKSVDGRSFIGSIQMFLYRRIDAMGATAAYQWKSTHELKVGMLTGFKDYFESGRIRLRSLALCEELVKVVRMEDGDLRADGRGKDDRVIAAAMATVPWLRSLKTQLIARGMTREQAIKLEEVAPQVTALQAAVTQHFQDIGYQPKQIKLH